MEKDNINANKKLLFYYFNYTSDDYIYNILWKVINKANNLPNGIISAFNSEYKNLGYIQDNKFYFAKESYPERFIKLCKENNLIINKNNCIITKINKGR